MKSFLLKSVALATLFFNLYANEAKIFFNPILCNDNALDKRVVVKVSEIANEVLLKTGIKTYVCIKGTYFDTINEDRKREEIFKKIKSFETNLLKKVKNPYVILTISYLEHHVNLLYSKELSFLDKDEILNGYVIPLLASKDKNAKEAKISAATLNGYAEIISEIEEAKKIKIKSNIPNGSRAFADFWKYFMYIMVLIGLSAYIYAMYRSKK